ncbi:TPA: N-acetylmuramoyl-L-alanine amidase [Streptococcus suis]
MVQRINKSYLNVGNLYSIKGVVIHNDAGSAGATAFWYVDWLAPRDKELGIAHYYIDRYTIFRAVDTYKIAYHTGDGVTRTSGNGNYIGYEVCQSMGASDADFIANENMALMQVAEDMLFYKLPVNRDTVRLHREFVPTDCPHRSWGLHGKSMNAVKDYFIAKIKHYQSLGSTVDEMIAKEKGTVVKQTPKPKPTVAPKPTPKPTPTASVKEYTEYGTFTATENIYFRNEPNLNGRTQGMYYNGESVNYNRVRIDVNGFVWISWVSASTGIRRWMPTGETRNGKRSGGAWGTFR